MNRIVECVPNFSEGRDKKTIEAIADAISDTPGCRLLDVDPGHSTHRTVITFVGDPDAVVEGALAAAMVARTKIDMRRHQGEHPRFGALDVCPFVPVAGVTMDDCVKIAETFGRRLAEAIHVPVYLYEAAARNEKRRKLSDVRRGEYEGLSRRLKDPQWQPDFGPAEFVPEWGASAVGARNFLIAYNVNILGTVNQAHRIALNLREAGRGPDVPGRLKEVKGLGWFVEEYNLAQVSVNLTDFHVTPMHVLYEAVKEEAAALKVGVAGSEIVGMVPESALLMAAGYYIEKEDLFIYETDQKIRLAVERLGLSSVTPFRPGERIIEYITAPPPDEPLAGLSLRDFINELSARNTAPGGGSASAAMAAMGAALGAMAAKLTYGVRRFEDRDSYMRQCIPLFHDTVHELIPMIDADTKAFHDYIAAVKLPKDTPESKKLRHERMQDGLKNAVQTPLSVMRLGDRLWPVFCLVAEHGNPACKSDIQVGARALADGIWGAGQNVRINLEDIEDKSFKTDVLGETDAIIDRAEKECEKVLQILSGR